MDLAVKKLQILVCHKTQTKKQTFITFLLLNLFLLNQRNHHYTFKKKEGKSELVLIIDFAFLMDHGVKIYKKENTSKYFDLA